MNILMQGLRILIDKHGRNRLGFCCILSLGTDQQQRDIKSLFLYFSQQVDARFAIQFFLSGKADIRDNPENIGLEGLEKLQCSFITVRQKNFGTGPHRQHSMLLIKPFFHNRLGLTNQFLVKHRQQ